jgi:hypothetical protein
VLAREVLFNDKLVMRYDTVFSDFDVYHDTRSGVNREDALFGSLDSMGDWGFMLCHDWISHGDVSVRADHGFVDSEATTHTYNELQRLTAIQDLFRYANAVFPGGKNTAVISLDDVLSYRDSILIWCLSREKNNASAPLIPDIVSCIVNIKTRKLLCETYSNLPLNIDLPCQHPRQRHYSL